MHMDTAEDDDLRDLAAAVNFANQNVTKNSSNRPTPLSRNGNEQPRRGSWTSLIRRRSLGANADRGNFGEMIETSSTGSKKKYKHATTHQDDINKLNAMLPKVFQVRCCRGCFMY